MGSVAMFVCVCVWVCERRLIWEGNIFEPVCALVRACVIEQLFKKNEYL